MTKYSRCISLFVAEVLAVIPGTAVAQSPEQLATVTVRATHLDGTSSSQTGVIVAAREREGIVVTASHLFSNPVREVNIWPPNKHQEPYTAKVLACHDPEKLDVAVLSFLASADITAVPLAPSDLPVGAEVLQIGYPLGTYKQVRRHGQVATTATWRTQSGTPIVTYDFAVIAGDSGSPVFSGGHVVGIIWGNREVAHATPVSLVTRAVETACRNGRCDWFRQPASPPPRPQYRRVVPQNPQPPLGAIPKEPIAMEALRTLERRLSEQQKIIDEVNKRLAAIQSGSPGPSGPTGPQGEPGRDGRDGTSVDPIEIAADVAAHLSKQKDPQTAELAGKIAQQERRLAESERRWRNLKGELRIPVEAWVRR